MPRPSVAKSEFSYNFRNAVRKIRIPFCIEIAGLCINNGNPIMLGRSVYRELKFSRPPICLTLIDKRYKFRGCSLGSIGRLHKALLNPAYKY